MRRVLSAVAIGLAAVTWWPAAAGKAGQSGVLWVSVLIEQANFDVKLVARLTLTVRAASGEVVARVVTSGDGDAETTLPPGAYVLESERPFEFRGRAYAWRLPVSVAPGQTTRIQLSGDNAEVAPLVQGDRRAETLRAAFDAWQGSVVTVWSETGRGSGFVVDRRGLVMTNERVVGDTRYAAVQFSRTLKVAASVVSRSAERNVAVLRVHPSVVADVPPLRLGFAGEAGTPALEGETILAIGSSLDQRKLMTTGAVRSVEPTVIGSTLNINHVNSGGPAMTPDGVVVGVVSFGDGYTDGESEASRIVRIDEARESLAVAERALANEPPTAAPLPVEPDRPFPIDAVKQRLSREPVNESDYQFRTDDFDVTFITPVLSFGVQYAPEQSASAERSGGQQKPGSRPSMVDPFVDFRQWAEYVGGFRAVLIVDVRPRLTEGIGWKLFRGWQRVRGGPALPAQLHFKGDLDRMQLLCGAREVVAIHPGKVRHRASVSSSAAVADDETDEGFYIYPPDAVGPDCQTVTLVLFARSAPQKGVAQPVPPAIVQRVWDDFAPFRALTRAPGPAEAPRR